MTKDIKGDASGCSRAWPYGERALRKMICSKLHRLGESCSNRTVKPEAIDKAVERVLQALTWLTMTLMTWIRLLVRATHRLIHRLC